MQKKAEKEEKQNLKIGKIKNKQQDDRVKPTAYMNYHIKVA